MKAFHHQHVQRESEQVLMRGLTWWLLKHIMLRTHEHGWTTWGPVNTWHNLVQPPMLVLFVSFIPVPYYVDPHTPPTPFQYYPCTATFSGQLFWSEREKQWRWLNWNHAYNTIFVSHACSILVVLLFLQFSPPLHGGWRFMIIYRYSC